MLVRLGSLNLTRYPALPMYDDGRTQPHDWEYYLYRL
jgi:hypothetical protein